MISRLLAALACGACLSIAAAPVKEMPSRIFTTAKSVAGPQFRAPALAASTKISLPAMSVAEKALAATPSKAGEPLRIGTVRALAKSSALETWTPVEGGFATRMQMASEGASIGAGPYAQGKALAKVVESHRTCQRKSW